MSVESLPYTVLLLLAQFTGGTAAIILFTQVRGGFELPFMRTCVWMTVGGALLTVLTALFINPVARIDGFPLDTGFIDPIRGVALAVFLFSLAYLYFLRQEDEPFLAVATGATTVCLSAVLFILLASLVRLPTWNIAGPLLTMFAGAAVLGSASVAMIWGHWYLVNPKLGEKPLNEMTLLTFGALIAELVVTLINAAIPVGQKISSNALLAIDLPQNPGFWLRIGIGIVFPGVLAYLAYLSSKERSMESATGLLYIAVGAILAGEAVGRGLLFVTGAAV